MAGITDEFGKEKKTRFLEMFLPLIAGIGASFMPNGGQALQGIGTVLGGVAKRRGEDAVLRQQDSEFEALKGMADADLNSLNAELARLEAKPFVYNPEWSKERNDMAAAERNSHVDNLRTQIKTAGDTFGAILRHAATTRDPAKAIAAMGVFKNSISSASGLDDDLTMALAKIGLASNDDKMKNEDQEMQRQQLALSERQVLNSEQRAAGAERLGWANLAETKRYHDESLKYRGAGTRQASGNKLTPDIKETKNTAFQWIKARMDEGATFDEAIESLPDYLKKVLTGIFDGTYIEGEEEDSGDLLSIARGKREEEE